jgi:succinyl-CoA synthetase beta subunit
VPAPTGEILDEVESKRILASWGLRPVAEEVVGSVDAALEAAARIGYPVVLKALVAGVTHKSELDVVRLGIASPDRLRVAYVEIEERVRSAGMALEGVVIQASIEQAHELLVGIKADDVFGPIVVLGWGGIFVEILRETSIRRAPLRREDAIAMIDGLRGIEILKGARGRPPSDLEALVRTLLGLSDFAIGAGSSIEAVDVNPLMLGAVGEGAVMVDASIQTRASHA